MQRGSALLYILVAVLVLAVLALPISLLHYMDLQRYRYEVARLQARYLAESAVFRAVAEGSDSPNTWFDLSVDGQPLGRYRYLSPQSVAGGTRYVGEGETAGGPLNYGLRVAWRVAATVNGGSIVAWEENP
ncbi:hypothetical protein [Thermus sp.]|uniref:hypothetical protein n=1 Tax=Thermus sp. TaxID=275 RepID=UPI00307DB482